METEWVYTVTITRNQMSFHQISDNSSISESGIAFYYLPKYLKILNLSIEYRTLFQLIKKSLWLHSLLFHSTFCFAIQLKCIVLNYNCRAELFIKHFRFRISRLLLFSNCWVYNYHYPSFCFLFCIFFFG